MISNLYIYIDIINRKVKEEETDKLLLEDDTKQRQPKQTYIYISIISLNFPYLVAPHYKYKIIK